MIKLSDGTKSSEFTLTCVVTIIFFVMTYLMNNQYILIGALILPSIYVHSRTSVKNGVHNSKKIDNITVRK